MFGQLEAKMQAASSTYYY